MTANRIEIIGPLVRSRGQTLVNKAAAERVCHRFGEGYSRKFTDVISVWSWIDNQVVVDVTTVEQIRAGHGRFLIVEEL